MEIKQINQIPSLDIDGGIYQFHSYCEAKLFTIDNRDMISYYNKCEKVLSKYFVKDIFQTLGILEKLLNIGGWLGYRKVAPLTENRIIVVFNYCNFDYNSVIDANMLALYNSSLLDESDLDYLLSLE